MKNKVFTKDEVREELAEAFDFCYLMYFKQIIFSKHTKRQAFFRIAILL